MFPTSPLFSIGQRKGRYHRALFLVWGIQRYGCAKNVSATGHHVHILMRHAARTLPPPGFVACGLLQLMLFGKSQNVAQRFKVNVRYYQFSEVLCQFSAGILHWVCCLTVWRNFVPTAMKAEAKRVPKSIASHSKWTPRAIWGLLGCESVPPKKEAQPQLRIY